MNVGCWSCRAVYRVDPALLPAAGVTARCSACGAAIVVSGGHARHAAEAEDWFAEERRAQHRKAPDTPDEHRAGGPSQDDWFLEEQGTMWGSDWHRALQESDAAAAPEFEGHDRSMGSRPVADRPSVTSWVEPSPRPIAAPVTSTRHPFLRVTPHERAQRLARALVSDLIAYHPGRREAARASGTLRIAFREEIARSYAVYAAEVGREMAEGTSYFQEALNEMVAQGRALF